MRSVDVVVPCYRYGHYLRECVNSVLTQQGVSVRVLIIDDASPDNTRQVAGELAEADKRVTVRTHLINRGHIATYNEGLLDWAAAEYSLLLSPDDVLAPGALSRAAKLMNRHPEVGFAYGHHRDFRTGDKLRHEAVPCEDFRAKIFTGMEFLEASCALGCTGIESPTAVVRTELQQRVGGYTKELPHSGDTEMWLRFALHGPVAFVDAVQAFKRGHEDSMSSQYRGARQVLEQQAAFETVFEKYAGLIPDLPRVRRLLARGIAEGIFQEASRAFDQGDVRTCREDLRLAVRIDPGVQSWGPWKRLRLKQFLGPRAWSLLRPLVWRLRKMATRSIH